MVRGKVMAIALVCKNEPVNNFDGTSGYRVAEIFETQPWEASPDHEFVDCGNLSVVVDEWYFDTTLNTFAKKPIPPAPKQPASSGVTTL
jgi:hypothetical protein